MPPANMSAMDSATPTDNFYPSLPIFRDFTQIWFSKNHFSEESHADDGDQSKDERFHLPHSEVDQEEQEEGVKHSNTDSP